MDDADPKARWAQLPERIDPQQWTTTQPLPREPAPDLDDDLTRLLLLGAAG